MGWPNLTPPAAGTEGPLWKRLGWMAAIWLASVSVLLAVAWVIRLAIL